MTTEEKESPSFDDPAQQLPEHPSITLLGAGTIGLSLAALHLTHHPTATITLYDTRPDLAAHISRTLPHYLPDPSQYTHRLHTCPTLPHAVAKASIIQESAPETLAAKQSLWREVAAHAPRTALLWSSTSGIPASAQAAHLPPHAQQRLLVVHPYNPPHIMPLLELVPSPHTSAAALRKTESYFRQLGRTPITLRKESTGFVANRLAFALFREACALVASGVVSARDLDDVVTGSMGPRWSVAGPFASYHAGGGEGGLRAFMEKIGGTVQACWDAGEEGKVKIGEGEWTERVCGEVEAAYGVVDTGDRDERTRRVLEAAKRREA